MQNANRRKRIRRTYGGYASSASRSHRPEVVKFYVSWVERERERETNACLRKDFIIIVLVMARRNGTPE